MPHIFQAKTRKDGGKGASRRLRREQQVPGILYGVGFEAQSILFPQRDIQMALDHETFVSQIITLVVEGQEHQALVKAIQRHPYKNIIMHADFFKVTPDTLVTTRVPLHFLNEDQCLGVRTNGGVLTKFASEIEVRAKASALPEALEIDLENLDIAQVLHTSELKLPKGVQVLSVIQGRDLPLAQVSAVKEEKADSETVSEAGEEGTSEEEK